MWSSFGERFMGDSGIRRLMEDLGAAAKGRDDLLMLGGGSPAHIPAIDEAIRQAAHGLLDTPGAWERAVGDYPPPEGDDRFITALAGLLQRECGWPITPANIALTNGSQSAFFYLFNLLAGDCPDGTHRRVLFPFAPEYIGYADLGLSDDFFVACRPRLDELPGHRFKYRVDFDALRVTPDIGAICVSRPTNPTANVLTDDEVARLAALAREHGIPFILDSAYGLPFPGLVYGDATPYWDDNTILCLSLSKFGLPGVRTGIVVARPEITDAIARFNAILNLSVGGIGAALATRLVDSGDIVRLSREVIRPFYRARLDTACGILDAALDGLPYALHQPEGAFFLWLWLRDCPVTSAQLYDRLKERGVIVVPGHYFFPGQPDWHHRHECLRLNYGGPPERVGRGLEIIAEEVRRAYAG